MEKGMHKLDNPATPRRPKQVFNPALDAPIVLTPDQLEKVAAGTVGEPSPLPPLGGGTTIGIVVAPMATKE
jgi:hypothetical protein